MGKHVHKLLSIDPETRTGVCAACGPCGLYRSRDRWSCNRLPGPGKANPRRPNRHELHRISDIDELTGIGVCSVCGPGTKLLRRNARRAPKGYYWHCEVPKRRYPSGKHGFSAADRDELLAEQGGVCAICGTSEPSEGRWHLDHDHATDEVRGVLCPHCNKGLGHFKDDTQSLLAAVAYLTSPGTRQRAMTVRLADYQR
jgi:hypothetical protein